MKVQLTRSVRVEVVFSAEQASTFRDMQVRVTAAYNEAAGYAFTHPEIKGAVDLHHAIYRTLLAKHGLKSQFVCDAQRAAMGAVAAVRKRIAKGKTASCPTYKRAPIPYNARTMTLRRDRAEVSLATTGKRVTLPLRKHHWIAQYDEWSCDSGKLTCDSKGRWWLHLTFTKDVTDPKPSANVIGCDRGIVVPAALSSGEKIGAPHWHHVDRRYFRTQRSLQAKGTKSAKRRLNQRARKWQRFRLWCDYNTVARVLEHVPTGATLILEDLTNIRVRGRRFRKDTRRRLHSWSFRRQQTILVEKCPERGIFLAFTDARYTSQKCSKCGHTSRKNRPSRDVFRCEKCAHTEHADINAARNIAANWATSQHNGSPPVPVNAPYVTDAKDAQSPKVGRGLRVSRVAKRSLMASPKPLPDGGGCLRRTIHPHRRTQ